MIPIHGWLALTLSALLGSHLLTSMCAAIRANDSRSVSIWGSQRQSVAISTPPPAHVDVRAQRATNVQVADAVDETQIGVHAMIALRQRVPMPSRSHLLMLMCVAISGHKWQSVAISGTQSQSAVPAKIPPRTPSGRCKQWQSVVITSHAIRPLSAGRGLARVR